jgi:hypothetical protein
MVEENITGKLEQTGLYVPEIPIERIASALHGWEIIIQPDNSIKIEAVDGKKSIHSYTKKTDVNCKDEFGKNKYNLEEIKRTILEVAEVSKKTEIPSQLKESPSINTLTYKSLPVEASDDTVSASLETFRKNPKLKRMIFQVGDLFFGFFLDKQRELTTITYTSPLDNFSKEYTKISKIFKFSDSVESTRKDMYV